MATATLDVTRTVKGWLSYGSKVSRVFEDYKVDLCRDGDKSLVQLCRERGFPLQQLIDDLMKAAQPAYCDIGSDWDHASISEICDHLEAVHHPHLQRELLRLSVLVPKVVKTYRVAHPDLEELQRSFERFREHLERHIVTEETVLLPALRACESNPLPSASSSERLAHVIRQMENDHDLVDDELRHIRRATNDYTLPLHTCAAYATMLDSFWELEWHLHKTIFEEDDILFPKATRHQAALRGE